LKIYLVRHAETVWHHEDRYAGHTEIDLTDEGYKQAEKLSEWAANQKIESIYTSTLKRSISTAIPTANKLQISLISDPAFCEVNFGDVEGLSKKQFRGRFPSVWINFQDSPADTVLPNGESGRQAARRALEGLSKLTQEDKSAEILLVSHGTLIRLLLSYFLNHDLNEYRKLFPVINNIGITSVRIDSLDIESPQNNIFELLSYDQPIK
jgi:probable phosphoglycerate mutase